MRVECNAALQISSPVASWSDMLGDMDDIRVLVFGQEKEML